jgi:hypothetical protein
MSRRTIPSAIAAIFGAPVSLAFCIHLLFARIVSATVKNNVVIVSAIRVTAAFRNRCAAASAAGASRRSQKPVSVMGAERCDVKSGDAGIIPSCLCGLNFVTLRA